MNEFKVGDIVYYPLMDEILKSSISEIIQNKKGIYYKLECGRQAYESEIFRTCKEAVIYCLEDERKKYEHRCSQIKAWRES